MSDTTSSIPADQTGDIDIDFADRNQALSMLQHVPAGILRNGRMEKHNTGVYFQDVYRDPFSGLASLHYEDAEAQGWYKIDLLNVWVYERIKDEQHLERLMHADINWQLFDYPEFSKQLIHIGNHSQLVADLRPRSISDMAMILALIRPAKRHLANECRRSGFGSIADRIWTKPTDGSYHFKKAHAIGYSYLVKVHALLEIEALGT